MKPVIAVGFAYRYEPDWLVDQLRENLAWADLFVEHDDRNHPDPWSRSRERFDLIRQKAIDQGADWLMFTAPDERHEPTAGDVIRQAVAAAGSTTHFTFPLREMWTPTAYRVDGQWGDKRRRRLTSLHTEPNRGDGHRLDLNIYHLKMIDNRAERARVHTAYNTWNNRGQGFGYMLDERGLRLVEVPADRMYQPAYKPYEFKVP